MPKTRSLFAAGAAAAAILAAATPGRAAFNYNDKDREARWETLRTQLFGTRMPRDDIEAVQLIAPETAVDAAVVPVTINLFHPEDVKSLYLVIDDNPAPVAAHFTFGPDADPGRLELRVRVDHITDMHAVAEMKDGTLLEASRLVKASGGCSAPMGVSDEEAMAGMGQMKLKLAGDVAVDKPVDATLMIRHPNFSGMQMNQEMHVFTPARYIKTIDVTLDGKKVFDASTDISMASNPVISFVLRPSTPKGDLKVEVEDSKNAKWSKSFPVPSVGN